MQSLHPPDTVKPPSLFQYGASMFNDDRGHDDSDNIGDVVSWLFVNEYQLQIRTDWHYNRLFTDSGSYTRILK